jgi:PAS domain S-box-containing protein
VRAVKALRDQLRWAMEATSDGIWDWNIETGEVDYSPAYTRMLGFEPEEWRGRVDTWAGTIHPEDRDRVLAANQACIDGKVPAFEVEYRLGCRSGTWKWILGRGKAVRRDPQGRALRMVGTHVDITERKRIEQAQVFLARAEWLGRGEDFFHALARFLAVELGMDGVCIDRLKDSAREVESLALQFDGAFLDPVSSQLDHTPCGAALGQRICSFPSGVQAQFPHDERLRAMGAEGYVGVTLWGSAGQPIGLIATVSRRPIENIAFAETVLGVVAGRAAAELERLAGEAARRLSELRLEEAFRASPIGMAFVSLDGHFKKVNPTFCAMLGCEEADLLELTYLEITHPEDREASCRAMADLLAGRLPFLHVEKRYLQPSGRTVYCVVDVSLIRDDNGQPLHQMAQVQDVTDRILAEEQSRLLRAEVDQMQKLESLGRLAGGVAHDMNNVLGAILGLASANLAGPAADSPAGRAFATIAKAATRGGEMVKSLLAFARQGQAELVELDLNALLQEEVRILERTVLSRVHLVLDLAADLRPILGNPSALSHAFMNLCVNAVDAMAEGGTLTLRTGNASHDWVEAWVEDDGAGMPPEVLERAMEPFFTTKGVGQGTGLGLSLAYSTVKNHHGQIDIHSEPGQGTCVVLRFPARFGPAGVSAPDAEPGPAIAARVLEVLAIDDDELIQVSMETLLGALGHRFTIATSGEEGLALLEAGLRPDRVILDMNMPGLGGRGTLPRIRALRPELPVLLATGRIDAEALDLVASDPHTTLLGKPFTLDDLRKVL